MLFCLLFFFNDTTTTQIYTLSLHDALPISARRRCRRGPFVETRRGSFPSQAPAAPLRRPARARPLPRRASAPARSRSEEHTSELQSPDHLVCRLLLEKKKNNNTSPATTTQH